ncbi:MAG: GyrI-like domain-containing protein [Thermoanaerobaculia bacterium]
MNKARSFSPALALALAAAALLLTGSAWAATPSTLSDDELRAINTAVAEAGPVSMNVVYQTFTGSIKDTGSFLQTFCANFADQGLGARYTPDQITAVVVLTADPDTTTAATLAVGFAVPDQLVVRPPLRAQKLSFSQAVRFTHVGPYEQLGAVEDAISSFLGSTRRTLFPALLRLYTDPTTVDPSEIRTEMVVPVG